MKHFPDPELEKIGLRMEYRVFKLLCATSLEPQVGFDWELSETEIIPIRQALWLNNIQFAATFYSENLSDLKLIRNKVGSNDLKFLELSSVISQWVYNILKLGVNLAFSMANTSDFKENFKSPEVVKMKNDLRESSLLLSTVKKELYMDSDIREKIDNLLNMISGLERKYKFKGFEL